MNILADSNIPYVKEAFSTLGQVVTCSGRQIQKANLREIDILLVRSVTRVDRELLEGTPVRFVGTATIGTDHVDQEYLQERGIAFASAPGCNAESVAQYISSALLCLEAQGALALAGNCIGIIGVGNVGSRIISVAKALGLTALLNDPPKQEETASTHYVDLETVLSQADIITLHVPLTRSGSHPTYYMVGRRFLEMMKSGAVIVNTSRGKVINEVELRESRRKLGGLVLDVWEGEPTISRETLNLTDIATPHIAGYSYDGKLRGTEMIYRAACSFLAVPPLWDARHILSNETTPIIDLTTSSHPLADAVKTAYDILQDDARMRKCARLSSAECGAYFDRLRAEYPQRREFSAFRVVGLPPNDPAALRLRQLGFLV